MSTRSRRLVLPALCAGLICASVTVASAGPESIPEPYTPQAVDPPTRGKPYVRPDGSISICTNDLVAPILERLNEVFVKTHRGFKFDLLSFSGLGLNCVVAGTFAFGATARDVTFAEREAFESRYGYPPTSVQIAWDNNPNGRFFPPGKYPPGVWVNAKNPVPSLTLEEVAAIFTIGSPKGDLTRWGQVVVTDGPIGHDGADWAERAIHVYLPGPRGGNELPIISTSRERLGGLPWTPRAEYLPFMDDVVNAVANDPFGIGLIGWWPIDMGWDRQTELGDKVRFLPLAEHEGVRPSRGGVTDRPFPLAGGDHLWINRPPGKPVEPWIKEYLRLALSREGQDIVASLTKTDGCMPLDAKGLARELAKLE